MSKLNFGQSFEGFSTLDLNVILYFFFYSMLYLTYLIPKCVQIPIHYLDIDFQVLAYMYCPYIGTLTSERIFPFLYTYKLWQWFLCLKMDKKRHFRHQFFHISNGGSKLYRINYDAKIVEFYGFAIKKPNLWLSDEKKMI